MCLQVLWKEAVALKVGPGSQSPELWSWAPTHGPDDMWVVEQSAQTMALVFLSGFSLLTFDLGEGT